MGYKVATEVDGQKMEYLLGNAQYHIPYQQVLEGTEYSTTCKIADSSSSEKYPAGGMGKVMRVRRKGSMDPTPHPTHHSKD